MQDIGAIPCTDMQVDARAPDIWKSPSAGARILTMYFDNQPRPMRNPAQKTVSPILLQPRIIRPAIPIIRIIKSGNRRKSLSFVVQRPPIDGVSQARVLPPSRAVLFEKWSQSREIDTDITVRE